MKNKIELSEWEKGVVNHMRRNKGKRDLFIATVVNVSSSGMYRHIKLALIYKGQFVNVTYLAAKLMGKNLTKKDALGVGGCGMDMIFHTLQSLYYAIGVKEGWKYDAVQHYRYF